MFIFAIIGFVAIFWCVLTGLVKLIPWLVLLVIITSAISFFDKYWLQILISVPLFALFYYLQEKEREIRHNKKVTNERNRKMNK
ncbi:hypothetical protein [Leuconostoc mesenteroides]|uniref:hypothetical protein n=1 Tax=Leuconostoc mesenteroides TaxID=1245 RepID=UPI000681AEBF|nr:hypothetical protein [Leuconostoc mesenteroides]KMY76985.1 hypothetical protein WZ79_09770 [Leuconostoc mesenteroides subsp. mesenteroides]